MSGQHRGFFNPRPKENVTLLKGKAKERLREDCAMLANFHCEKCGRYAPLHGGVFGAGHMSHKRPRKVGGDVIENVCWKCWNCHLELEHVEGKK